MLYEFEGNHNAPETTKNMFCAKGEGAIDHRSRNFTRIAKTSTIRPSKVGQKPVLQIIEVNPVSKTTRVTGKFDIL